MRFQFRRTVVFNSPHRGWFVPSIILKVSCAKDCHVSLCHSNIFVYFLRSLSIDIRLSRVPSEFVIAIWFQRAVKCADVRRDHRTCCHIAVCILRFTMNDAIALSAVMHMHYAVLGHRRPRDIARVILIRPITSLLAWTVSAPNTVLSSEHVRHIKANISIPDNHWKSIASLW